MKVTIIIQSGCVVEAVSNDPIEVEVVDLDYLSPADIRANIKIMEPMQIPERGIEHFITPDYEE